MLPLTGLSTPPLLPIQTSFLASFWGEKHRGFDVLYANFSTGGPLAAAEFLSVLRELGHCEEAYQKGLARLGKRIGGLRAGAPTGSFAPCWDILAEAVDGVAGAHAAMSGAHQALLKEAQKYSDELAKTVKAFKDSEHQKTQASSAAIKTFSAQVLAKRLACQTRQAEARRLQSSDSTAATDKEKRRAVTKLESALKELSYNVEKYNSVRAAFVDGMSKSCAFFEEAETQHVAKMLDFVDRFLEPIAIAGTRLVEAKGQLQEKMLSNSADHLLTDWVQRNGTGDEMPQPIEESVSAFLDLGGSSTAANSDNQSLNNLFSLESQQSLDEKSPPPLPVSPAPLQQQQQQQLQQQQPERATSGGKGVRVIFSSLIPGRLSRAGKEDKSASVAIPNAIPLTPTSPEPAKVDADGFIERDEARDHEDWRRGRRLSGGKDSSESESNDSDTEQAAGKFRFMRINSIKQKLPETDNGDLFKASAQLVLSPPTKQQQKQQQQQQQQPSLILPTSSGTESSAFSLDDFQPTIQWSSAGSGGPTQQRPLSAFEQAPTLQLRSPPPPRGRPSRRANTPDWSSGDFANNAMSSTSSSNSPAIPLAVRISECLHCRWTPRKLSSTSSTSSSDVDLDEVLDADGGTCRLKAQGSVTVSVPASELLSRSSSESPTSGAAPMPALAFRLNGLPGPATPVPRLAVKQQQPGQFLSDSSTLTEELLRLARGKPDARFLNLDLLTYEVPLLERFQAPVQLKAVWRCLPNSTELLVRASLHTGCKLPIHTVAISTEISGGVTELLSETPGRLTAKTGAVIWEDLRLPVRIRASFPLTAGPGSPALVRLHFQADDCCISECAFATVGAAYKLAMSRRRLISGQYAAEPG